MNNILIDKLKECGFIIDKSGRGILQAFQTDTYVLEPHILVEGAHATDIACIHYSDVPEINGLCYYSSLFEELPMMFPTQHNVEAIVKKINKYLDSELVIKWYNGFAFLVIECDEKNIINKTFDYCLSAMLKAIGQLDYLLQTRRRYLQKKYWGVS